MKIAVNISVGEALDKLTILWIKRNMIVDAIKLDYINQEIEEVESALNLAHIDFMEHTSELSVINRQLWDVNDRRKVLLKSNICDVEYVELTKQESGLNDLRFRAKQKLNDYWGSDIQEQKSYEGF